MCLCWYECVFVGLYMCAEYRCLNLFIRDFIRESIPLLKTHVNQILYFYYIFLTDFMRYPLSYCVLVLFNKISSNLYTLRACGTRVDVLNEFIRMVFIKGLGRFGNFYVVYIFECGNYWKHFKVF